MIGKNRVVLRVWHGMERMDSKTMHPDRIVFECFQDEFDCAV